MIYKDCKKYLVRLVDTISKYSTYCTACKISVNLSDIKFVKLANNMATIEGNCKLFAVSG